MSNDFRKSDSIEYALTKWYGEIVETHAEYKESVGELISFCQEQFLQAANNLQEFDNKKGTKEVMEQKEQLIRYGRELEPELIEFSEYLYNYKTLIEDIDGFELDLSTPNQFLELIKNDISTIKDLSIAVRDLVKAANAAFRKNKAPSKKVENDYEEHLKTMSSIVKKMDKESNTIASQFNGLVDELKGEVEIAKKLMKERVA
jgi:hypothetical protein